MARIMIRRGSEADWSSKNPVLAAGEPGFATDTKVLKVGDGEAAWNDLDGIATASLFNLDEAIDVRLRALGLIL